LSVTTHSITAVYAGDGNFNSSTSAALSQTVDAADTSTVVVSSLNPATAGKPVTFTATVTAGSPSTAAPTGTVQFQVDGANLGSPVALSGGSAGITTSSLTVGTHTITALYASSDGSFNPSTGTLSGLVVKAAALSFQAVDGVTIDPVTGNYVGVVYY